MGENMHIRLLAMGTRGDVQPAVALALGLKAAGIDVSIGTTLGFQDFVSQYDIPVQTTQVDVKAFMTKAGTRKEKIAARKAIVQQMLDDMPALVGEADALIYSPAAAMGAPHVAEQRGIPSILSMLQPYLHPTGEFPVIGLPALPLGAGYNRWTYSVFHSLLWLPMRKTINQWRVDSLGLPPLRHNPIKHLIEQHTPTLYGFSPQILSKPDEWGDHTRITGYWFLDQPDDWQPSAELQQFLDNGDAPVYIGFGSMSSKHPEQLADTVLSALKIAGVRGIVSAGWRGLSTTSTSDDVLFIDSVPHDWLFPRMAAVVHHGGAGTTAAGLRGGVPSIVVPVRGDQPFWGKRIYELGVGTKPLPQSKLRADDLAAAIQDATSKRAIAQRASQMGEAIRAEDGVNNAVNAIMQWMNIPPSDAHRQRTGLPVSNEA